MQANKSQVYLNYCSERSRTSTKLKLRASVSNFDNTSSERSHVARCSRAVRVTINEHCQSGKMKASNFDNTSSERSRVVQLQTKNSPPELGGVPQGRGSVLCG